MLQKSVRILCLSVLENVNNALPLSFRKVQEHCAFVIQTSVEMSCR